VHKAWVLFLVLFLFGCAPQDAQLLREVEKVEIPGREASGLTWHTGRETFFIVTDEGRVLEVSRGGTVVHDQEFPGLNFEGITFNPQSGMLYAAIEERDRIVEIDPDSLAVLREFAVSRKLDGSKVITGGKEGFEGIEFVPDASHPDGGTFFVVNQATGEGTKREPSAILEVDLPLHFTLPPDGKKLLKGEILRGFVSPFLGLSGIHFDSRSGHLFAISDTEDRLLEATLDGDIVRTSVLPGQNQEGVAMVDGDFFIVQDEPATITFLICRFGE